MGLLRQMRDNDVNHTCIHVSMTATRLPRAQRRLQVIGAAAEAFLRAGYDGTSVEDVARAAGVTRLIVYRIFETKDALYRAVLEQVITDHAESFSPDNPEIADIGIVRVVLGVARRHPDGFRLLWRHAAHEPDFAADAALFKVFANDYAATLLRSVVADDVLRHWASATLVAHLYDGICGWLDTGEVSRDEDFAALLTSGVRALVNGWAAPN